MLSRTACFINSPSDDHTNRLNDFQKVDEYLKNWDRFAQGENALAAFLRDNASSFHSSLTRLLQANDKRAPACAVFYAVVQVGGFIPVDSQLGKALANAVGPDLKPRTPDGGESVYFSGDLYFWWETNADRFEAYPLFDEWRSREFAQRTVIPMYRSIAKAN